jgi:Ni,Fe-hydrogenase III small subunit/ferredoxin
MWVLRGLRNGVLTTRWPARPDACAQTWRGTATIRAGTPAVLGQDPASTRQLDLLCPTGAIGTTPGGPAPGGPAPGGVAPGGVAPGGPAQDRTVRLDRGRCVQCGRCVRARPEVFTWSAGPAAAALSRDGLVVPRIHQSAQSLAAVRDSLRERTRALRRSVHLRHVDAGSDGTEEWEILALLNPVYDVHRLGIFLTASPRHADVLLVTGAGARGMAEPLRRAYDAMPNPKLVIAVGTDAVSGGLVSPSYATTAGVGATVPVDVWLPGSPPSPFSILHALLLALGRLPPSAQENS